MKDTEKKEKTPVRPVKWTYWLFCALTCFGVIVLDQVTKRLAVLFVEPAADSVVVIPHLFRFTYVENTGAAFGSMTDKRWVFLVLSTVAIAAIGFYLARFRPRLTLALPLLLIVGGGIGNMIDRIVLGYVVDFIDFYAFPDVWYWVFNAADACVCIGAAWLVVILLLDIIRDEKKKKAEKTADPDKHEN